MLRTSCFGEAVFPRVIQALFTLFVFWLLGCLLRIPFSFAHPLLFSGLSHAVFPHAVIHHPFDLSRSRD